MLNKYQSLCQITAGLVGQRLLQRFVQKQYLDISSRLPRLIYGTKTTSIFLFQYPRLSIL